FSPEVISYAVWLYFRFPLSLRMVEVRIPIYSGRVFRLEAGHRSDLKPATIPK
ncbi:hypothetical protein ACVME9_009412, partial [Bradyrhizobium liaoningense]